MNAMHITWLIIELYGFICLTYEFTLPLSNISSYFKGLDYHRLFLSNSTRVFQSLFKVIIIFQETLLRYCILLHVVLDGTEIVVLSIVNGIINFFTLY